MQMSREGGSDGLSPLSILTVEIRERTGLISTERESHDYGLLSFPGYQDPGKHGRRCFFQFIIPDIDRSPVEAPNATFRRPIFPGVADQRRGGAPPAMMF